MSEKKLNKDGFPIGEPVSEKDYFAHVNKPKKVATPKKVVKKKDTLLEE
ncbi:MAG: hypothetical protein U9O83_01070 [Campylobacterota bacterium]|nr:hypothetical protein [Campylobacterota bacterium]